MPRRELIRTDEFPYHVYNRSNNKEFFYIDQDELWFIFMTCLKELVEQFDCRIHCFVLMSNHYHLIITTTKCNIGEAMKYLHREVARKVNRSTGRMNHFFGGRYKWSVIDQDIYFWNCVKYVFRNPIRAKICQTVNEYPYSSLNRKPPKFKWTVSDFFLDPNSTVELDTQWLNEPFLGEIEKDIGKGLRRREFTMPRKSNGTGTSSDELQYKKGTVT